MIFGETKKPLWDGDEIVLGLFVMGALWLPPVVVAPVAWYLDQSPAEILDYMWKTFVGLSVFLAGGSAFATYVAVKRRFDGDGGN